MSVPVCPGCQRNPIQSGILHRRVERNTAELVLASCANCGEVLGYFPSTILGP